MDKQEQEQGCLTIFLGFGVLVLIVVLIFAVMARDYTIAALSVAGIYGGSGFFSDRKDRRAQIALAIACIGFAVLFINKKRHQAAEKQTAAAIKPAAAAPAADMSAYRATMLTIPHNEPTAEYYIVYYKINGHLKEVVVERKGSSGTSFARREIDCGSHTQRYLGFGDTLNQAMLPNPDPERLVPVEGSSADATMQFACANL